ncbi:MAG: hypothetical protein ACOX02_06220 [Acholeplasmatales bacterium]
MIGQASMILSVAFIVIIILSAFAGFIKGMKKSIFQLVFSLFFFILALLIIPFIAEAIINKDISAYRQLFPAEFQDNVSTVKGTISSILMEQFPEQQALFAPGSTTLEIIYGVIKLVLIIVLFLVYFLFSLTILKLITLIFWQFVKPKEKEKKRRLIGTMIGGFRGLLTVLLLAIPLAGLSSIYSSVSTAMEAMESANNEEGTEETESFEEDMGEYGELFTSYDKTWVAKICDTSDLDEKMFDSVFKITVKIDDKKESLKIRKELMHIVNIYDIVMRATGGNIDENIIFQISNDDLEEIKENLDNTNVLKLVQAVGVEYLYGMIKENNLDKGYETHLTPKNLKSIDLKGDIITLFNVIQIINRNEFNGSIEEKIFSFDEATATEIVEEMAKIEWLGYLLPMGLNTLLNSEDMQQLITMYDIDVNAINKPSPDELVEDFKNIKNVYITLKDLGVNNLEDAKNLFGDDFLTTLEDEQVEEIVDVIFDFELLDSNVNLIAAFIHNEIDKEPSLQGLISKEDFIEKFDKEEVKYVVLLAKLLAENTDENGDVNLEVLLNNDSINKLSRILAYSKILSEFTPPLLESVFNNFSTVVVLEVPNDVSYKNELGEQELKALFNAFKTINDYGMLSSTFDVGSITNTQITNISSKLSASITIRHNITAIIQQLINEQGYTNITIPDFERDHWTSNELYHTLRVFTIVASGNMLEGDNSDNLAHSMARSVTINDIIVDLLEEAIADYNYSVEVEILDKEEYFGEAGENELKALLDAVKTLNDYGILSATFDFNTLDTDEKILNISADLSASKTIRSNITAIIKKLISDQGYTVTIADYAEDHWTTNELYHTIRAFKIVTSGNMLEGDNSDNLAHSMSKSVTINSITKDLLEEAILDYNYEIEIQILENDEYFGESGENELKALFNAVKTLNNYNILSSTFSFNTLDTDEKILNISADLSASKTVRNNINGIIVYIVTGKGYNFVAPSYPETHWSTNEIYYTISALKVFEINSIDNDNLHTLTNAEIGKIAKSKTITDAFKAEVYRMNANVPENASPLKGKLVIPEVVWESTETTKGEFENILLSLKEVQGNNDFSTFNPSIEVLYGKNKEVVFASEVIMHTFVEKHFKPLILVDLEQYFEPKDYYGNDYVWYGNPNDTFDFLQALEDLNTAGIDYRVMDFNLFKTVLKSDPNKPREVNDAIIQSRIFTHSLTKMFKELVYNQGGIPPALFPIHEGDPEEWGTPTQDGKLLDVLNAIRMLP